MFEAPDSKDLKKIIINSDVVKNKTAPILLFSSNKGNNKLSLNRSWFLYDKHHLIINE